MGFLRHPIFLVIVRSVMAGLTLAAGAGAQEPSAALKRADEAYRQGVAALHRNDMKTARSLFEEVIKLAPGAEQGHSALGAVMVREGQLNDGIRELQKALSIKPEDAAAQENLALAYTQTGAAAKAVPLFAKLETAATTQKRALPVQLLEPYARALAANGQSAAAVAHLKQAIAVLEASAVFARP